jgi:heme/copper-type cytochrome/quinol oxidase subunit 2
LAGLIGVYGTGMGMSNILSYWFLMGRLIQSKFLLFGMVFLITTTSLITLLTVLAFRALNAPKTNFAVNKLMRISAWIPSVILLSIIAIVTYLQSKDLFAVANLFN